MLKRILTALLCAMLPLTAQAAGPIGPFFTHDPTMNYPVNTPGRETCGKEDCYWETPMDYTDTQAVWAMLMAPITVIDGNFRTQIHLMAEPRADSAEIGEITCASQGVHVLEHLENGWSKIECYSSSFKESSTKAWNALQTGYVQTKLLKEVQVRSDYALIVDKLTQRCYVYKNGVFYDELLASTGLSGKDDPWNETRSGEFMIYSPTGQFKSEPYLCRYGLRYNDGDLLHEIPYKKRESGKDYTHTEPLLGQRASHGCLRIQRKRTEKGTNMTWLWNNLSEKMRTRLVVWEDWPGRQIPVPAANTVLYYNTKAGAYYHDSPSCYGVLDKYEPLTAFTYGELGTEDFEFKPCEYCVPPRTTENIAQINAAHAIPENAE